MTKKFEYLDKLSFSYKDKSYEEVSQIINKELPIKLIYNEDLINKIYKKYPLLTKTEIAVIVKATFETIRDVFILNKAFNINHFICHSKLYFKKRNFKNKKRLSSYVRLITPNSLR